MTHTPYLGRASQEPEIVARVREILAAEWDPSRQIRSAVGAGPEYYQEQAVIVVAMLAAAARESEVQGYLRQQEQAALGSSLHPFDARRRIAEAAWRAVRSL